MEGPGRGGLQQCRVDPQTVTLKGKGGRLTSSDWEEGVPFPFLGELGGSVCLNRARGRSSQAAHLSLFSGIFIFFLACLLRYFRGKLGEATQEAATHTLF